jgi:hypothetical protein
MSKKIHAWVRGDHRRFYVSRVIEKKRLHAGIPRPKPAKDHVKRLFGAR